MTGLLLINFGGPRTLEEVRPFLYNLFADGEVMQLPAPIRIPLAHWISRRRTKQACEQYARIGGGSPICDTTEKQAAALAFQLPSLPIQIGYRYCDPTIGMALDALVADGVDHIVALSLFPHYSKTTTGSSIVQLNRAARKHQSIGIETIDHWYDHPAYLDAVCARIDAARSRFDEPPHLLFSAHGIPKKYAKRGDPYPEQIEETVRLLNEKLEPFPTVSLSFQSKVGPVEWLRPYTDDAIKQLAADGVKRILVCPLSFVSDHIETLYEIDILYGALAKEVGIVQFERTEGLNTSGLFIDALAQIVSDKIGAADGV